MAETAQGDIIEPEVPWFAQVPWETDTHFIIEDGGKHTLQLPEPFPFVQRFFSLERGSRFAPNFHQYLEIGYIVQGEAVLECGGKEYPLSSGDVFVMGDNEFHNLINRSDRPVKICVIYFMPDMICCATDGEADIGCIDIFRHHDARFQYGIPAAHRETTWIASEMESIYRELENQDSFYRLAVKSHLRRMLLIIARHYGLRPSTSSAYEDRKKSVERLNPIFSMLRHGFRRKITIGDVANAAGMSVSYFCRFFRLITGVTFTEYLIRLRVDKAKELLVEGELPITTISLEVGFDNHSYFNRVFRRLNGVSPREYSRRLSS
jgi:AraC-like DNA-binding protein/quercetin dioxygenase-like cupin family protein